MKQILLGKTAKFRGSLRLGKLSGCWWGELATVLPTLASSVRPEQRQHPRQAKTDDSIEQNH
jgi:hypothetical protein